MDRFLRHGSRETWKDDIFSARASDVQISVSRELHNRCRATDRVFPLSRYNFALILRKIANSDVYTLVGACKYSIISDTNTMEAEGIRQLADCEWLLSSHEM
ncbi:hypothetical protein NW759_016706, partial [Fusarium solani]